MKLWYVKKDAKGYKDIKGNDKFIENANFRHQFLLNGLKFYDELRNELS